MILTWIIGAGLWTQALDMTISLTAVAIITVLNVQTYIARIVGRVTAKPGAKGAITSKIKHAIKLKTSPARLAQLLHNCRSPHYHFVLACSQWRRTVQSCIAEYGCLKTLPCCPHFCHKIGLEKFARAPINQHSMTSLLRLCCVGYCCVTMELPNSDQ